MPSDGSYHHGDLRRAVLDAAVTVVIERGPDAISMRDLARRAGVSHAAPAHHFGDRAGLLTAIAVQGYRLLADAFTTAPQGLREIGVRYVEFALAHPAHFEVMFRPDLLHPTAPELLAARERTAGLLRGGVGALPDERRGADADLAALAAWSLAHGFVTLWRGGNLARFTGGRPAGDVFAAVAGLLFTGPDGPAPPPDAATR